MKMPHMVAIVTTFILGVLSVLVGSVLVLESDRLRIIPWLIITYFSGIISGGIVMFVAYEFTESRNDK